MNTMLTTDELPIDYIRTHRCLYIAAREGQVKRAARRAIPVVGWWQLHESGYFNKRGEIVAAAFTQFDTIIFANPDRVWLPVREIYRKLMQAIREL